MYLISTDNPLATRHDDKIIKDRWKGLHKVYLSSLRDVGQEEIVGYLKWVAFPDSLIQLKGG